MPHIKPKSLHSQHGVGYHGSYLGVATEALAINDIVIATGYSGDRIKFSKADGNANDLDSGVMGVADHAAPIGGSVRVVSHKLLVGTATANINTLASAVGRPVFLSDTAGGWGLVGTGAIVGSVVFDSATLGAVLLSPSNVTPARHPWGNTAGALLADTTAEVVLTGAADGQTFACVLDEAAKTVKLPASATRVGMKIKIVQVVDLIASGVLTILANTGNTFSLNSYAVGAGVTVYRLAATANNSCVISGAGTNSAFGAGSTITAELVAPNEWMLAVECVPLGTGSDAVAFATV